MPFIKRKNTASKSTDKRNSCLGLLACFRRPQVDEPENNLQASAVADHRNKLRLPLLPWLKCKRKKKMKKTIPFDLQCTTSSLSFFPSSYSNTSTPKDHSSKGWCKRKQKTLSEAPSNGNGAPSCTASVESTDRFAPFQSSPRSNTSQSHDLTIRSDLLRRAIYHTASDRTFGPIGRRRLRLGAGLWVMVTSLGVMLIFGRTGAVLFLSSCWYIVPMVIDTISSSERRDN